MLGDVVDCVGEIQAMLVLDLIAVSRLLMLRIVEAHSVLVENIRKILPVLIVNHRMSLFKVKLVIKLVNCS
jgi:hypothetical protein